MFPWGAYARVEAPEGADILCCAHVGMVLSPGVVGAPTQGFMRGTEAWDDVLLGSLLKGSCAAPTQGWCSLLEWSVGAPTQGFMRGAGAWEDGFLTWS